MSYFSDAKELINHAEGKLHQVEKAYSESLRQRSVKQSLLIEIKNVMENLRSALDFTAHGLFDKYGEPPKSGNYRVYYPYAVKTQTRAEFNRQKRVDACIPGLSLTRPDIVDAIEAMQYWDPNFEWLPDFMELNNENKHQRLTPQTRKETKELRISSGGAAISIGQGAAISIGPGASIQVGGAIIAGGQTLDVNHPPAIQGSGQAEVITWVSFHFSSNDKAVLPFLKHAIAGVKKMVMSLSAL